LHPKDRPKPLEPNANQEDIHLTPLQLIVATNTLAERNLYLGILLLGGSLRLKIFRKFDAIIATKSVTLVNIVVIGKNLITRQVSLDINFICTKNDPHVVLIYNVIGNELIHSHSSRTYEVFSC